MQSSSDATTLFRSSVLALTVAFGATVLGVPPKPAMALSELQQIPGQTADAETNETDEAPDESVPDTVFELPMPDPLIRRDEPVTEPQQDSVEEEEPETPVEVLYDMARAPEPVRRMRELIVEAAASGDIERLRPLLGKGVTETQVSVVETNEGTVETLKALSGDDEGIEILAILLDVLATGFVHVDAGTSEELYVWPYFTHKSLNSLTPPEKVELLRIVTAGDFAEMQEFGAYNFYRVGITPDGQWKFFVAGD